MNYYISDLHLFCKSQTKQGVNYDNRPFENTDQMHDYILRRWNARVTNSDTVYILGDISLRGCNGPLIGLVAQLKGKKVLIKGNHDDVRDYRYALLFDEILDYKELTDHMDGKVYKLVLQHYPVLMWKDQHKGAIHLYGHTHNSVEDAFYQDSIRRMNENEELTLRRHGGQKIQAINVGACMPWINYEPRSLKELLNATEV